jgi:hypothetical protein
MPEVAVVTQPGIVQQGKVLDRDPTSMDATAARARHRPDRAGSGR